MNPPNLLERSRPLVLLLSLLLASCGHKNSTSFSSQASSSNASLCTLLAVPAVVVNVTIPSGASLNGLTVSVKNITSGQVQNFSDISADNLNGNVVSLSAGWEQAGTYDISATLSNHPEADADGVAVAQDGCHVATQQVPLSFQ